MRCSNVLEYSGDVYHPQWRGHCVVSALWYTSVIYIGTTPVSLVFD